MKTTILFLLLFLLTRRSLCQSVLIRVPPPNVPEACICETQIFEADEMKGTMKFEQRRFCNQTITCLVYIKPLAGYVVSVENKILWNDKTSGQFKLFYYQEETNETEMIPTQESHIIYDYREKYQSQISSTPAGVGLYINYTRAADRKGLNFTYTYERIPAADMKTICPPLVVNVNSTMQVIKMGNWPKSGCTIRVQSSNSSAITMHRNCNFPDLSQFSYLWNRNTIEPKERTVPETSGTWYTLESGTDVQFKAYYPDDVDIRNCELSFVSLEYDPCDCFQNVYHINENGTGSIIQSPGYPEMFCPSIYCDYAIDLNHLEDDSNMIIWVLKSIHIPNGKNEQLYFKINGEKVSLGKWHGNTNMNILSGAKLEIEYTASSTLSLEHGFSLNITAYSQPHDCRCPSNNPKLLPTDGSHEMSIPAHCNFMLCRFEIHNNSKVSQTLHLDINYTLSSDDYLYIEGDEEFSLHTGSELMEYDSSDFHSNNSQVTVTYFRDAQNVNTTSEFKIKWHWITKDECNCGETSFMANPARWSNFSSPRYRLKEIQPNGNEDENYCNNADCTYRISAPEGHHLQFVITDFETEIHRDFLTFTEGDKILKSMSGHHPARTAIESDGQYVEIRFHSDGTVTARGSNISFIAIPNVGYLPEAMKNGYIGHFVIGAGVLVLLLLIALCTFMIYKRDLLKSVSIALGNPVHSFSNKVEEVVTNVDKE